MKYAELRRQAREGQRRAAQAEEQRRRAVEIMLGFARERECGHRVIAHTDWPCPHPECTPSPWQRILLAPRVERLAGAVLGMEEARAETLVKERLVHNGETVWVWRVR